MREDRSMALGWAGQHFSGGFDWLAAKLRDVTGIGGVVPERDPDSNASVMVRIDQPIRFQSTERLPSRWRSEGLVLVWPAELKKLAEATYRTGMAKRVDARH